MHSTRPRRHLPVETLAGSSFPFSLICLSLSLSAAPCFCSRHLVVLLYSALLCCCSFRRCGDKGAETSPLARTRKPLQYLRVQYRSSASPESRRRRNPPTNGTLCHFTTGREGDILLQHHHCPPPTCAVALLCHKPSPFLQCRPYPYPYCTIDPGRTHDRRCYDALGY